MICLADNDVVLKLSSCDLLAEAVAALGASPAEVYVLNSAVHKLLNPKKPGQGEGEAGRPRIRPAGGILRGGAGNRRRPGPG
jgi:hypothetical protein